MAARPAGRCSARLRRARRGSTRRLIPDESSEDCGRRTPRAALRGAVGGPVATRRRRLAGRGRRFRFRGEGAEACRVQHTWGHQLAEFLLAEALSAVSHGGARFPVPVQIDREDELEALCRRHPRLLALSVHMPLNRFLHLRLREWGVPVRIVVRKYDGPAWGLGERLDRIVHSPHVFLSIRQSLRSSAVVFLAVDGARRPDPDGGYSALASPAALRFAHRTQTPVFVYRSLLTQDGGGRVLWREGGDLGAPYEEFARECRSAFSRIYAQPFDPRLCWQL